MVSEPAPVRATIVAVSDDPNVLDDLRFGLPAELEAVGAEDARAAIRDLSDGAAPAAIVVDLQTGSAGGFALARDLSQVPSLRSVPVVMLIERDQDRWLARQAGAREVLRKPLEPGILVEKVLSVLSETPTEIA